MQTVASPSPNFSDRRNGKIARYIVVHYTAIDTASSAINWLQNPESSVSAHYLIARDGTVHEMVAEDKRAWHAGRGFWQGETDMNSASIGIELDNTGTEPYAPVLIERLVELCHAIMERHDIPAENVIGHSDLAPGRKIDPGTLFPWEELAPKGLGIWVDPTEASQDVAGDLKAIGYQGDDVDRDLAAFLLHWGEEARLAPVAEHYRRFLSPAEDNED